MTVDRPVGLALGGWRRCVFRLLLLIGLIGLAPLAYALPPDQTWIAGSYDGDDLDDAVTSAVSIDAASKSHRVSAKPGASAADGPRLGVLERGRGLLELHDPSAARRNVHRADPARSPPREVSAPVH